MASAQVVETSVNTNNSPSQDYTTNPDDHSNHNKVNTSYYLYPTWRFRVGIIDNSLWEPADVINSIIPLAKKVFGILL